jgi:lupus La protein
MSADQSTLAAVKRQVEFYFSDSNFRKDTFLRAASETDPDGFVPISTLLTFNKLKSLTTDPAVVAQALGGSEVAIVSDDGTKIRRASELPVTDSSKQRTLYVKGYPVDDAEVTHDSIINQFSEYGKVNMVRLRRDPATKQFKGSCFVEFAEEASLAAAVAAANKDNEVVIGYKGTPFLCVMTIEQWLKNKSDRKNRPKDPASSGKRKADEIETAEEKPIEFTPGLVLRITNLPENVTLYNLKDAFKPLGDMKYVEYEAGESQCCVRFGSVEGVNAVLEAISKGFAVLPDTAHVAGSVIAGDEEAAYWKKVIEDSNKRSKLSNRGGRGGGRNKFGRKGGRGGGRGGRGGGDRKRTRRES